MTSTRARPDDVGRWKGIGHATKGDGHYRIGTKISEEIRQTSNVETTTLYIGQEEVAELLRCI